MYSPGGDLLATARSRCRGSTSGARVGRHAAQAGRFSRCPDVSKAWRRRRLRVTPPRVDADGQVLEGRSVSPPAIPRDFPSASYVASIVVTLTPNGRGSPLRRPWTVITRGTGRRSRYGSMGCSRKVSQRADAVRNRAAILDAAEALFRQDGHLTLARVADAAGVGKATVLRRFGDLNGLVEAVIAPKVTALRGASTPPTPPSTPATSSTRSSGPYAPTSSSTSNNTSAPTASVPACTSSPAAISSSTGTSTSPAGASPGTRPAPRPPRPSCTPGGSSRRRTTAVRPGRRRSG